MTGNVPFEEALAARISLIKPSLSQLEECLATQEMSGSAPKRLLPESESTRSSVLLSSRAACRVVLRPFPERSRWRRCSTQARSAGSNLDSYAPGWTRPMTHLLKFPFSRLRLR